MSIFVTLVYLTFGFISAPAQSQVLSIPGAIRFQGQIVDGNGVPLEASNVTFKLQLTSPAGGCVLYEETQNLNMTSSNGVFDLALGSGTATSGTGSSNPTPAIPLQKTFSNAAPFTGLVCGTYTPAPMDVRKLKVTFNDGTQTVSLSTPYTISSVPYALYADSLQGKQAVDFVQINTTTSQVTQANLETIFDSMADVTKLAALIAGTSTEYAPNSTAGGTRVPVYAGAPTTPLQGSVWFDSTAGKLSYYDGTSAQAVGTSGGTVASITAGSGLSGGTITTTGTISMPAVGTAGTYAKVTTDAQGRVSSGTTLSATDIPILDAAKVTTGVFADAQIPTGTDTTKLPLAGGTMSGAINMGGQSVTNTGYVTMNPGKYFGLGTYTDTTEGSLVTATLTPGAAAYKGVTWYNTTTNAIKYWDGAAVVTLASGSTAISSINGLTTSTQVFANGSAGTAPAFVSSGSTHTLNIPMASTAATTAGLLSNTDYAQIVRKDGTVVFTADQSMGSHKLTNVTDPSSAQDAATRNYSDTHAAGKNVAVAVSTAVTGAAGNGFVLTWDQAGSQWTAAAPATNGTVTNVTGSLPISVATGTSTPVVSIATANGSTTGALSSADWNTFNGKLDSVLASANIFVGNGSNVATAVPMSGDATISNNGAITLKNTGTAGTYTKITTDAQGRVSSATNIGASEVTTALGYTPVNQAGDTMSGALAMGGNNLSGVGDIGMNSGKTLMLGSYDNTTEATLTGVLTNTSADIGKTWYNTASNQIKFWNGTAATPLGVAGSGFTNLNGLTASTQSFANGSAGTAPAFSSSGSTHTLNIPLAATASATAGLLSNTDYVQIIRKDGTVAFTADQSMGSHKLTNVTDPASAQDASTKNYADTHAAGKNVAAAVSTAVTGAAGNGFVLTWDQAGSQWTAAAPATNGTVTGVDLALPPIFSISGGPVTSTGTLTGTLVNQAPNLVFAGPASGGVAAPTFRGLAAADIPNLDAAKVTTGTLPVARGGTGSASYSNNALVMANGTGTALTSATCSIGEVLQWSGTAWACASVTTGTVTNVTGTAPISVATGTTTPAVSIATANTTTTGALSSTDWNTFNGKLTSVLAPTNIIVGNASSVATSVAMSGDAAIASSGALTLKNTGSAGTYTKVTTDAQGRVSSATSIGASDVTTALGYTPVNKAGDTMSGALAMGGNNLTGVGNVGMNSGKTFLLGSYDNTAEATLTGTLTNTTADIGKTWYNTATNQIKFWNGTAATALGIAGAGLTNLNGLTVSAQSFANGAAGTAPAFVSSGSTHTLNIPLAATASTTAGLLSNTDYVQIIRKDGTVAFTADQSMGSHKLTNVTDPVGLQDAATRNYSDTHAAGKNVAAAVATAVTGSAGNGFVLTWDQAGSQWTAAAPASSGTVTSVNLALPSIFTLSGGPVTTSGTLTGALNTQTANTIFAGPGSGGAVAPTFRSLTSADLPTVPVAKGGTGSTSLAPNGLLMADGTGSTVSSPVCGTGMGYISNGTSFVCTAISSAANTFVNGGNTFSANATVGLNDAFSLGFKTNNTTQMTLDSSGNLGIGIAAPTSLLQTNQSAAKTTSYTGVLHTVSNTSSTASVNKIGMDIESTGTWNGTSAVNTGLVVNATGGTTNYAATFNGGNVGIGTTSPTSPLYIGGQGQMAQFGDTGNFTAYVNFQGGRAMFGYNQANGNTVVQGTTSKGIEFNVNNATFGSGPAMNILSTGLVGVGVNSPKSALDVNGSIKVGADATVCSATIQGAIHLNSTALEYCNGTAWTALSTSTGLTSLNGLTGATQTFATPGTTGTAPAWTSSGTAHTLNIPLASAGGTVTAGLLSNAEYATLNGKLSATLVDGKIFTGNASNVATGVTPSGDVTMTNAGAFKVTQLQGSAVSATTPATAGQMLRWSGSAWTPNFVAMTDLRSTVTGTNQFASTCASNQTLTYNSVGDVMSCANISLPAGQVTGTLPATNGGTGQASYAVGDLLYASTTTALSKLAATTSGYVLTSNGAGTAPSWQAAAGGSSGVSYPTDTTAGASIAIGASSLANQTTSAAYRNIALGYQAMGSGTLTTNATDNISIGYRAIAANTSGSENVAIGGKDINGFGGATLALNTTGNRNIAIGSGSLQNNTTGVGNTVVGWSAASSVTTGGGNTLIGSQANGGTDYSTAIGSAANAGAYGEAVGQGSTSGLQGLAMGWSSTSGPHSLAFGTGTKTGTGNYNSVFGEAAGNTSMTGTNNVLVGYSVGSTVLTSGSSNILIGTSSAVTTPAAATSNFINIGNLIFATGATGTVGAPAGNFGVSTTSPTSTLTVNGSFARNIVIVTTSTYTIAATDTHIIANRAGTMTITLPAASSFPGREISIRTITANTVISASSNVVPIAGGAAGTAILSATAGKWALLISDGTNWQIQMGN
jgi:hypothetical protein